LEAAIEQINGALAGLLPGYLGIKIESAVPDVVVGSLVVEEKLCTTGGILHGGAMMALADTLGAVVAFLNMQPNTRTSTVESKTNFLKAAKTGAKVTATCRLVNRGRTMVLLMTELRDADNRLLAVVSQSQIVLPA
jgi:uncharacterized protein (TIGR00369 family)